jgi:hypothetical protein
VALVTPRTAPPRVQERDVAPTQLVGEARVSHWPTREPAERGQFEFSFSMEPWLVVYRRWIGLRIPTRTDSTPKPSS